MKKGLTLLAMTLVCCCRIVSAQQPGKEIPDLRRDSPRPYLSPGAMQTTPEMWFYEQERSRYEDPRAAVRRRAEYRAAQRENRIESLRWYGMSNSRPSASVTPLFGAYSPMVAGSVWDPFVWHPMAPAFVIPPSRSGN